MWQPEMVEKSSRSSCLVKFCCLGIIAQAADPDCEVVIGNSNRNSRLFNTLRKSQRKYKLYKFDSQNTATGRTKFDLKHL